MSGWMGLNGGRTARPIVYSGLQVSSSRMDMPLGIFWGTRRLSTDALWYNGFTKKAAGGKGKGGGGKGGGNYTYYADCILGLSEGVIDSIQTIWPSGSTTTTTTLADLNMTFFSGTAAQAPWSYVVGKYPADARSYGEVAYLGAPQLNLGSSATIPDNGFECVRTNGFAYTHSTGGWINPTTHVQTSAVDVLLSDCAIDLLTSTQYGFDFTSGDIGDTTQWATYMRAQGLFYSPLLKSSEKGTDILKRWGDISNTWIYWSGTQMQFVPLCDTSVTGNGVTYTPEVDVAYALGLGDFITNKNEDPVKVTRADPADCYNVTTLSFTDRTIGYVTNPVEYKDQTLVDTYGRRSSSSTQADEICDPAVARMVVQLLGKRAAYIRNNYSFKTSYRFIRCLPGTVLTLTTKRLNAVRVRVKTVQENDDGSLQFQAEEFPSNIGTYVSATQSSTGNVPTAPNENVAPGSVNTPAIVEPSSAFTGGVPILLIAASWGINGGSARVNISFDNVNYQDIGTIEAPAVQGLLTAGLASHADPDTVDTLSVDCTESLTPPQSVSHADADALRTLSMVCAQPSLVSGVYQMPQNGELLAFGATAATGTYTADLTYLRRGQYGSSPSAHSTGDQFTVLDVLGSSGTSIQYRIPSQYIGQTIYVKIQCVNVFGTVTEDLSTVNCYSYVPTGAGYGTGTGGVPSTPTGLAAGVGDGQNDVVWNANPSTDNVTAYKLYAGTGTGVPIGSCSVIFEGLATGFVDTGLVSGAQRTYYVKATNAVGDSAAEGPANATQGSVTYPFRILCGTPGRLPLAGEEVARALMFAGDQLSNSGTYGPANWQLSCEVAPSINWTCTLKKNGASIGTGTINAGATTGTFTFASMVSFSTGDSLTVTCPVTQDTTCSGPALTILGTRTQ